MIHWTCPGCNYRVLSHFDYCGKCGTRRPDKELKPSRKKTPPKHNYFLFSQSANKAQLDHEIITMIEKGMSEREVAAALNLSHGAVHGRAYRYKKREGLDHAEAKAWFKRVLITRGE